MDGVSVFYSYKGGSGRTTTIANIASLLATKYKVACIDLDFNAPGLGTVFNITKEMFPQTNISDYFRGLNPPINSMCIDMNKTEAFGEYNLKGKLYVFPYPLTDENLKEGRHSVKLDQDRLSKLLKKIFDELDVNLILIDSRSGFTEESTMAFMNSNLIVTMLRYSEQHIMGTLIIRNILKRLQQAKPKLETIFIFNSVPRNLPPPRLQNLNILKEKMGNEGRYIFQNERLLWKDEIIVFDDPILDSKINDHKEIMNEYYKIARNITTNAGLPYLIENRWY